MIHLPPWLFWAVLVLIPWGIVGLLQKLSTNFISAESSMIWSVVGFLLMLPWLYSEAPLASYSTRSLMWALLAGGVNAVGGWALFTAMKNGGKASIVTPLTGLYPLVVVIVAPILLHESINWLQGVGLLCALTAAVLLSM